MDYHNYPELPVEAQALLLEIGQYSAVYETCLALYRKHDIPDYEDSSQLYVRAVREAVSRFDEQPPVHDQRRFAGWL